MHIAWSVPNHMNNNNIPIAPVIKKNKKSFFFIIGIYAILYLMFVKSISGGLDLGTLKENMKQLLKGNFNKYATGFALFSYLLGTNTSSDNQLAGVYQSMLILLASLVLIWSIRQMMEGVKVKAKIAYYKCMQPLVPLLLVMVVIGIQTLPIVIGMQIYGLVNDRGLAVGVIENLVVAAVLILLALLSMYMISSSIFGLYIVTLPDMTPLRALRSARALVLNRRFATMRKLVLMPVLFVLFAGIFIIPILVWATRFAEMAFLVYSMFSLAVVHTYLYNIYRELLK